MACSYSIRIVSDRVRVRIPARVEVLHSLNKGSTLWMIVWWCNVYRWKGKDFFNKYQNQIFSWGFYIPNFWGLNPISSFLRFSGFLTRKIHEKNNSEVKKFILLVIGYKIVKAVIQNNHFRRRLHVKDKKLSIKNLNPARKTDWDLSIYDLKNRFVI